MSEADETDDLLFQEFVSKEANEGSPKCPSCGVTYHDHLGLNGTCKKLQEIFALVDEYVNNRYLAHNCFSTDLCNKILALRDNGGGK